MSNLPATLVTVGGISGYVDSDGTAHINLKDAACGLGFIERKADGAEYVRWQRVEGYLSEFGFSTSGENPALLFIPENIFYRLAMKASNDTAIAFQEKVANEILPAIRKTGSYSVAVPRTFAEALRLAADQAEQIEVQQKQLVAARPKVEFFDAVASSKDAIEMGRVAKVLGIRGLGRNKLFALLREKGVLMSGNIPYQEYVDRGYFRVLEQKYVTPDGETRISIKALVYQRGLDYIRRLLPDARAKRTKTG